MRSAPRQLRERAMMVITMYFSMNPAVHPQRLGNSCCLAIADSKL